MKFGLGLQWHSFRANEPPEETNAQVILAKRDHGPGLGWYFMLFPSRAKLVSPENTSILPKQSRVTVLLISPVLNRSSLDCAPVLQQTVVNSRPKLDIFHCRDASWISFLAEPPRSNVRFLSHRPTWAHRGPQR